MLRLEVWTSVFKLTPRKGEFIFKSVVSVLFYYFFLTKETMNTYLVHCLFVALPWLSVHVVK